MIPILPEAPRAGNSLPPAEHLGDLLRHLAGQHRADTLVILRPDDLAAGGAVLLDLQIRDRAATAELLNSLGSWLATVLIVSQVTVGAPTNGELQVRVQRAAGQKCERCWVYAEDVGAKPAHPTICGKCADALA